MGTELERLIERIGELTDQILADSMEIRVESADLRKRVRELEEARAARIAFGKPIRGHALLSPIRDTWDGVEG